MKKINAHLSSYIVILVTSGVPDPTSSSGSESAITISNSLVIH